MIHLFAQTPIAPVQESMSAFQMVQHGGYLMGVLSVLSVVALGVFFERLFYYKRSRMNVSEFLAGVCVSDHPLRGRSRAHRFRCAHGDL